MDSGSYHPFALTPPTSSLKTDHMYERWVRWWRVWGWCGCRVTQNRPAPSRAEVRSGTCCASFPQWHPHSGCCLQEELWTARKKILSSAPREKHGRERQGLRQGRLPKTAQHERKGFWNLVWIQKSSLCTEADSRFKKWISSCDSLILFIYAHFSPVCFQKGLTPVSFSPEGRIETYKEWGPLHAGEVVTGFAEEIFRLDFRAFADNGRHHRELQAEKQAVDTDHIQNPIS